MGAGDVSGTRPRTLVLACRGAAEGALSVVRTLGRRGVAVDVLADHRDCEAGWSKYSDEFVCIPDYTRRDEHTLEFLTAYARRQNVRPVLFPTADPDLLLVSRLRARLETAFALSLASPALIENFTDKTAFRATSAQHGFPVPQTHAPRSESEVAALAQHLEFPVILKPSNPTAWTDPRLQVATSGHKALIIESPHELLATWSRLAVLNPDLLVQDYIRGPDESHYSLHAYISRQGEPLALFTGRKVRVFPAHAGSGCFVQSVRVPEMIAVGTKMLRDTGYTGIAVINFKQDCVSGQFRVHEINPRISQWNILATACGVDIPFLAYSEAAGLPLPACGVQREDMQYVNLRHDLKAFREYRRCGEWSWRRYLRSLARPRTVHQLFSVDDPMPFVRGYLESLRAILKPLVGWRAARTAVNAAGKANIHAGVATAAAQVTGSRSQEHGTEGAIVAPAGDPAAANALAEAESR